MQREARQCRLDSISYDFALYIEAGLPTHSDDLCRAVDAVVTRIVVNLHRRYIIGTCRCVAAECLGQIRIAIGKRIRRIAERQDVCSRRTTIELTIKQHIDLIHTAIFVSCTNGKLRRHTTLSHINVGLQREARQCRFYNIDASHNNPTLQLPVVI